MKKITVIIASMAAILCIGGIGAYAYMNSNTFLINKYIKTCSVEAPNSPDYCKCKAYFNSEYNKDIFKQLAYADKVARTGLMQTLPQDKSDFYDKNVGFCLRYLDDNDFFARFYYPFPHSEECVKTAYYEMPQHARWYIKTHNKDENNKKLMKIGALFSRLINRCLDNYDSIEEHKNQIVYDYFWDNKALPAKSFEKCLDKLSSEELKLYKKNDVKTLIKFDDCIEAEYSVEEIISTASQAIIILQEEENNMRFGDYQKNRIRKKILKCMEDKISRLSPEELQKFKENAVDSDILKDCLK